MRSSISAGLSCKKPLSAVSAVLLYSDYPKTRAFCIEASPIRSVAAARGLCLRRRCLICCGWQPANVAYRAGNDSSVELWLALRQKRAVPTKIRESQPGRPPNAAWPLPRSTTGAPVPSVRPTRAQPAQQSATCRACPGCRVAGPANVIHEFQAIPDRDSVLSVDL